MSGKGATIPDRIRGCIAIFLTVGSFTWANFTDDRQWQASLVFAGVLYMCTALAIVFSSLDE